MSVPLLPSPHSTDGKPRPETQDGTNLSSLEVKVKGLPGQGHVTSPDPKLVEQGSFRGREVMPAKSPWRVASPPLASVAEPCHNLLRAFTIDTERTLVVFPHLLSTFSQYVDCLNVQVLMLLSVGVI